jgi:hypothetical protein
LSGLSASGGLPPSNFQKKFEFQTKNFPPFSFLRAGGILKKLKDCLPAGRENFADGVCPPLVETPLKSGGGSRYFPISNSCIFGRQRPSRSNAGGNKGIPFLFDYAFLLG